MLFLMIVETAPDGMSGESLWQWFFGILGSVIVLGLSGLLTAIFHRLGSFGDAVVAQANRQTKVETQMEAVVAKNMEVATQLAAGLALIHSRIDNLTTALNAESRQALRDHAEAMREQSRSIDALVSEVVRRSARQ